MLRIAAAQLRDGPAAGIGYPQHWLSGASNVVKMQLPTEHSFSAQIVQSPVVLLVVLKAA